jgi:hypothetical protein
MKVKKQIEFALAAGIATAIVPALATGRLRIGQTASVSISYGARREKYKHYSLTN